jgi:hypothetical protein
MEIVRVRREQMVAAGRRPARGDLATPPDAMLLASLPGSQRDPRLKRFQRAKEDARIAAERARGFDPNAGFLSPRDRRVPRGRPLRLGGGPRHVRSGNPPSAQHPTGARTAFSSPPSQGPLSVVSNSRALPRRRRSGRGRAGRGSPSGLEAPNRFAKFYERGDVPCGVQHGAVRQLVWKSPIDELDLNIVLPVFFDGLVLRREPCCFLAREGSQAILRHPGVADKVLAAVPALVPPLKKALTTGDRGATTATLKVLQLLVLCGGDGRIGERLVPYFRQLLPAVNKLVESKDDLRREGLDGGSRKGNLADIALDTLHVLEAQGGREAFATIKYMVPTYESFIRD